MYHYVRERASWKGSVPISPREFEEQLDYLGKTYNFVLPRDIHKSGNKPNCIISFDDATKDQYEIAFDILKKKGIPAYFTVMSGVFQQNRVPTFHLVHTALSNFKDKDIWEKLRLIAPSEESWINKAYTIYHYESDKDRAKIKYCLNYLLDKNQARSFLEHLLGLNDESIKSFINDFYISKSEFKTMIKEGMDIGIHCVNHEPFNGDAIGYFNSEIKPCYDFIQNELHYTFWRGRKSSEVN